MTAVKVAGTLPAPDSPLVSDGKEEDWTAEGYALAKSAVYVEPVGPGLGPYTLNTAYTAHAQEIAKQRVSLARVRLAALLKGRSAVRREDLRELKHGPSARTITPVRK
jgi:hypothetical protein